MQRARADVGSVEEMLHDGVGVLLDTSFDVPVNVDRAAKPYNYATKAAVRACRAAQKLLSRGRDFPPVLKIAAPLFQSFLA